MSCHSEQQASEIDFGSRGFQPMLYCSGIYHRLTFYRNVSATRQRQNHSRDHAGSGLCGGRINLPIIAPFPNPVPDMWDNAGVGLPRRSVVHHTHAKLHHCLNEVRPKNRPRLFWVIPLEYTLHVYTLPRLHNGLGKHYGRADTFYRSH